MYVHDGFLRGQGRRRQSGPPRRVREPRGPCDDGVGIYMGVQPRSEYQIHAS